MTAIKVVTVLGLFLSVQFSAGHAAGTPQGEEAKQNQMCSTNAGPDGLLFSGFYGIVNAPAEYTSVTHSGAKVTVWPDIRYERGSLSYAGDYRGVYAGSPVENAEAAETLSHITFLNDSGEVVHRCMVRIVDFDQTVHDLALVSVGGCNVRPVAGLPELSPGHVHIFELPEKTSEISSTPTEVVDVSPLTTKLLQIRANALGIGSIAWIKKRSTTDQNKPHELGGLCFVDVHETYEAKLDALPVCLDAEGNPLNLGVGETATLRKSEFERNFNRWSGEFLTKNPPFSLLKPENLSSSNASDTFDIVASRSGDITFLRVLQDRFGFDVCLLRID